MLLPANIENAMNKSIKIAITSKKTAKNIALKTGLFTLEKWAMNNEIHMMLLSSLNNAFTMPNQQQFWHIDELKEIVARLGVSYADNEIIAWNITLNTKQLKRLLLPRSTTLQGNGINGSKENIVRIMQLVDLACISNEQKIIDNNGEAFYPVILRKRTNNEYMITIAKEVALWHANQKKEIVLDKFKIKQEGGFYQHSAAPMEAILYQPKNNNLQVTMRLNALFLAHKEELLNLGEKELLAITKEELTTCLDGTSALKKESTRTKLVWKEIYQASESILTMLNNEYTILHQRSISYHPVDRKGKKGLFLMVKPLA